MQAAIDRVLRTFTLKHPLSLVDTEQDRRTDVARDEAAAFASRLLDNYKDQLARRAVRRD